MSVDKVELQIQALLDGTISEADFIRLQQRMETEPAVRQIYYRYVRLHQCLEMSYGGASGVMTMGEARMERLRARYRKVAAWAAVAVLLISAVMLRSVYWEQDLSISYQLSRGAKIEMEGGAQDSDDLKTMPVGARMKLLQGSVELTFASGVRGWVHGPADLELVAGDQLKMSQGVGRFDVVDGAEGFTVVTDEFRAVDLGTEFGVAALADLPDELHVISGAVAYELLEGEGFGELTAGQAVRSVDGRAIAINTVELDFPKTLPNALRYAHWSFDSERPTGPLVRDENIHQWMENGGDPVMIDGPSGQALALDSEGAGAVMTNWLGVLGDTPRSVAFWIKQGEHREDRTSGVIQWGRQQVFGGENVTTNSKWSMHLDHSSGRVPTLNVSFGGVWYYCPNVLPDDGQWHHVAAIYRGGGTGSEIPEVDVYIDGVIAPTYYASHPNPNLTPDGKVVVDTEAFSPLQIGGGLDPEFPYKVGGTPGTKVSSHFTGAIDELFIIEGAIDKRDVWRIMNEHRYAPEDAR